ncbi:MAG: hypothetical protein QGG42_11410 [Phycisphaerae bacterium]|jgi:hypothetical protein|nr:hypothetical protein [Phycisphaerae bacterium]
MEMQVLQLRKLFEARVTEISNMFADAPPPEVGDIEPAVRVLKGFLFALEGMHRSDYLHGLPFTAVQELNDRVDRAVEAIKALPKSLDRKQGMAVLSVVDSLHRLCLQENLMAGGMDASKLGKLTVILEHKLGDVLETIDSVAGSADGHADKIQEAVANRLAGVQEVYNKEIAVLESSVSLAAESINSQTDALHKRQTEAMEAFDKMQTELVDKREQFQGRLDEQLATAQGVVDKTRNQQQTVSELVAQAGKQLTQAQTAIQAMAEITQATEAAGEDLESQLAEGKELITSIREFMKSGTENSAQLASKLSEAQEAQARIEQIQQECAEFATESKQKQAEAIEAAKETAAAAEGVLQQAKQQLSAQARTFIEQMQRECQQLTAEAQQTQTEATEAAKETTAAAEQMLQDAQKKLNAQSQTVIAQMKQEYEEFTAQARRTQTEATEATKETAASAEQMLQDARKKITAQSQAITAQMTQEYEQFTSQAQQTQTEATEATKETASAAKKMLQDAKQKIDAQSQSILKQMQQEHAEFTTQAQQSQTEATEAAGRISTDAELMLHEAQQKMDSQFQTAGRTLTDITSRGAAAVDASGQIRQQQQAAEESAQHAAGSHQQAEEELKKIRELLDRGGKAADKIDELVRTGGDMKVRMEQTLAEAGQGRDQIAKLEGLASEASAAIRQGKEEALEAVRETIAETERQQRQLTEAVSERRQAAKESVTSLRGDQILAAELLVRTQKDVETLQAEMQQIRDLRSSATDAEKQVSEKLEQAGGTVDELDGVLTAASELRAKVETNLVDSAEALRQVEQIEQKTESAAEDLLRRQEEALAVVRGEAESAGIQRQAAEASFAEQLEAAQTLVSELEARKTSADNLLEQTQQQRDNTRKFGRETAQIRVDTAEASGEIQAKLQEVRSGAADLTELLTAGTESRSKIDAQLTAASQTVEAIGEIQKDMGQTLDGARKHTEDMDECKARSEQIIAEFTTNSQQAIDNLEGQTTDLVTRNEQLQQEIEDLFGQAADGGLFRQFDDLAEQSAPRRSKWLKLLLVAGGGGAVLIAAASSILAAFSSWASVAVLLAGLTPLAFFMYFCITQYNVERRSESQYQYRAAMSRSMTAYRKLLAAMKAEGIADSPFVDRMLATLFGATSDQIEAPQLAPPPATEPTEPANESEPVNT